MTMRALLSRCPKLKTWLEYWLTYSDTCNCVCGCSFFCRPVDSHVCDYCRAGHHSVLKHDVQAVWTHDGSMRYSLACIHCEMPQHYAHAFPKCCGVPPGSLPVVTIARRGADFVARRLLGL